MLFIAALLLQTTTLDANPAKAALTCAQALTIAGAGTDSPMRLTSQFTHLAMQVANAENSATPYFDRLNQISADVGKGPTMSIETAKLFAPQCKQRFPLAGSTAPARLPTDSFRRDVLCFGTLSLLQGAAEEIKEDTPGALAKIKAGLAPLNDRLTDAALQKRGLGTDGAFLNVLTDEMRASVTVGNPLTVAASCGVTGL